MTITKTELSVDIRKSPPGKVSAAYFTRFVLAILRNITLFFKNSEKFQIKIKFYCRKGYVRNYVFIYYPEIFCIRLAYELII